MIASGEEKMKERFVYHQDACEVVVGKTAKWILAKTGAVQVLVEATASNGRIRTIYWIRALQPFTLWEIHQLQIVLPTASILRRFWYMDGDNDSGRPVEEPLIGPQPADLPNRF